MNIPQNLLLTLVYLDPVSISLNHKIQQLRSQKITRSIVALVFYLVSLLFVLNQMKISLKQMYIVTIKINMFCPQIL